MRLSEKLWRDRRLPSGNFAALLSSLRALPDEAIRSVGASIDWLEPAASLALYSSPGNSPRYRRGSVELDSPIHSLLRLRDPRLNRLLLRPDMLPHRVIFEGRVAPPDSSDLGDWRGPLREAFALADAESARLILSFSPETETSMSQDFWRNDGAAMSMARSSAIAPGADWEKTFQLACELGLRSPFVLSFLRGPGKKAPGKKALRSEFSRQLATWMLPAAARAGNEALASALLAQGALVGRLAVESTFEAFEPKIFSDLLARLRSDPASAEAADSVCAFADAYRDAELFGRRVPQPLSESLLAMVGQGLRSLLDANWASPPEKGRWLGLEREIFPFLEFCLEDGLSERPAPDPSELLSFREGMASLCAPRHRDMPASWLAALDRFLPAPAPAELCAYLRSGEFAPFDSRALGASGWDEPYRSDFFERARALLLALQDEPDLAESISRKLGARRDLFPAEFEPGDLLPEGLLPGPLRSSLESAFLDSAAESGSPSRRPARSV